ncbi:MAG: hypothetical protein RBS21_00395 [Corynebacterium sp.]|nr:hypothetical protein [Corynebacterium sp.]
MTSPPRPSIADYWTGPSVWLQSPIEYAEGSYAFVGVTLFPAGINPGSTQTAVVVLGPSGAQANLSAVATGPPGPAATLRNANLTQVPYGDALPSPAAQFVEILPGVYDLDIALNSGAPGQSGAFAIAQATDLSAVPADKNIIQYDAGTSKFNPVTLPIVAAFNATGIAATGSSAGNVRTLSSIAVPPIARPWIPLVAATAEIVGTANTQVDLVARVGGALNSQSGVEVARGMGTLSSAAISVSAIQPTFMGGLLTSAFGQVAAGSGATIYLNCEEQQGTTDNYSTGRAGFSVFAVPVG